LYDDETLKIGKGDQKYLDSFEKWCWKRPVGPTVRNIEKSCMESRRIGIHVSYRQ
jgi:hypothetical protein